MQKELAPEPLLRGETPNSKVTKASYRWLTSSGAQENCIEGKKTCAVFIVEGARLQENSVKGGRRSDKMHVCVGGAEKVLQY